MWWMCSPRWEGLTWPPCAALFWGRRSAAFVIHGGTIMAILEGFAQPRRDLYDYHIANGAYLHACYDQGVIFHAEKR